ncbi:hypothetical protein SAMN02910358_00613 [Lachnospiraceae bacterium XBB1006]|nr:hypothetical protein SAMN02910358_00613 [Lachnospiraceae bacterium XBB1006]
MKKRILGLLMATLCISSLVMADNSIKVLASGGSSNKVVSLSADNKLSFPEEGIVNATMIPGDTVKQEFVFKNGSKEDVSLYMSENLDVLDKDGKPIVVEEGKAFKNDLLKHISLDIKTAEGKQIYIGPCTGNDKDWSEGFYKAYDVSAEVVTKGFFKTEAKPGICIGTIPSGKELTLVATIKMDGPSISNKWQNCYTLFNWEFYCNGLTPEYHPGGPSGPTDPSGGDPNDKPSEDPTNPPDDNTNIDDDDVPKDDKDLPDDDDDDDDENVDIDDDDVPKTNIHITDDDVPKDDHPLLAKTGFGIVHVKEAALVVVILIGVYGLVTVIEKKKAKK